MLPLSYCVIECVTISYMLQAMSPDGEAIVTGAGDETLRFWNVFSKMRSTKVFHRVLLAHNTVSEIV